MSRIVSQSVREIGTTYFSFMFHKSRWTEVLVSLHQQDDSCSTSSQLARFGAERQSYEQNSLLSDALRVQTSLVWLCLHNFHKFRVFCKFQVGKQFFWCRFEWTKSVHFMNNSLWDTHLNILRRGPLGFKLAKRVTHGQLKFEWWLRYFRAALPVTCTKTRSREYY